MDEVLALSLRGAAAPISDTTGDAAGGADVAAVAH
jgi:hypothetical protein